MLEPLQAKRAQPWPEVHPVHLDPEPHREWGEALQDEPKGDPIV